MTGPGSSPWRLAPLRGPADAGRSSGAPSPVNVTVSAEPGTELFLIDSFLKRQANGVGYLDAMVPPGIYKLRALRFGHRAERLIEITQNTPPIQISVEGAYSVLPTARSTANHGEAFSAALAEIHGAHQMPHVSGLVPVYVFGFVANGADARTVARTRYFPLGQTDARAGLKKSSIRQIPTEDGTWHVARIDLKPGLYVLEIDDGREKQRVMLPVMEGSETHLGLRITVAEPQGGLMAVDVAIQARRDETLSGMQRPDWQHYLELSSEVELDNAARYSLARRRYLVLDDDFVMRLLNLKFRAPLTGLAAAHLMFDSLEEHAARVTADRPLGVLERARFGDNLTATVLHNMTQLMSPSETETDVGTPGTALAPDPPASPDLVAVYLRSGRFWEKRAKIDVPPLFTRSWEVLQRPEYAEHVEISPALWSTTKMNREMGPYFCWTPMRMSVRDFVDRYAWLDEEPPVEELGADFENQTPTRRRATEGLELNLGRGTTDQQKLADEERLRHRLRIPQNVIERLL